jgi:hypothetical protein
VVAWNEAPSVLIVLVSTISPLLSCNCFDTGILAPLGLLFPPTSKSFPPTAQVKHTNTGYIPPLASVHVLH